MRNVWFAFALTVLSALTCRAADGDLLVEVREGTTVTTGKLIAKDKDRAMLLDRVGCLHEVPLKANSLKTTTRSFQSLPMTDLRNQLSREFGKEFGLGTTRHYIVLATAGRASSYATIFEEQFVTMQRYFKLRGFTVTDPAFPLIAIVFPNRTQFTEYAQKEGAKTMTSMLGYYSPRTNRVALFETSENGVSQLSFPPDRDSRHTAHAGLPFFGSTNGDVKSTMIHEATHQVAYNIGLHPRLGDMPRWVVEGMATLFEPDGVRNASSGSNVQQRINRDRYVSFQNFAKSRRAPKSLRSFIEADDLYESAVLDFYAQSWAFSFFLAETRPRNYATYLKRIAARDPFAEYTAKERFADFKESFQTDIEMLDIQFLRFMDGLK